MNRRNEVVRDAAVAALLCSLVIAFTWRIALAGRVLASGDIFTYFYPYWAEATRAIRSGRLPLWNPTLFMGVPFAANSQIGLFYPLNWLLWLLLPAHRSVHVTIVLHLCLAAVTAYVWGRRALHLGRPGSWTVGALFALGGYLGAQVEHINQLQGLAWLPLMLTLVHRIARPGDDKDEPDTETPGPAGGLRSLLPPVRTVSALAAVIAMVLLAGHTQTAFISLFGVGVYGLAPPLLRSLRGGSWRPTLRGVVLLGGAVVLSVALAAVQLLPTWGLSRLSVRAQGLPFNERVSFSLSPTYLARALLPALSGGIPPENLEYVAYVGVTGLALAVVGVLAGRRGQREGIDWTRVCRPDYLLVLLGLFFALGLYNPLYLLLARYVPGFAHFRVPARWLALYGIGVAGLAGRGIQALWERRPPDLSRLLVLAGALGVLMLWAVAGAHLDNVGTLARPTIAGWLVAALGALGLLLAARHGPRAAVLALSVLLTGELFLASRALPRARATAPQAFTSMRPAIAHLLASDPEGDGPQGRFLSMSDITFDPGDLSMIETIYGPQLSDEALYDLIIATKQKEVLSPNLPLAFDVPAVDGYGGGLLPLRRYVMLQRAFLSADEVSIDGRLRENLARIPDGRWLSLLNVQHLITDKLRDAWIDDVFYDLQFRARLSQGETIRVGEVPDFEATALGIVSHLDQNAAPPEGTPVGSVRLAFEDGQVRTYELGVGQDVPTAEAEQEAGLEMAARVRWPEPKRPVTITLEGATPTGAWVVRGMSLIDERTGSFQSLVVSDQGEFRLAHSGDVKIYENLDVLPRAFIVPEAQVVSDDEAALEALSDPDLDLSSRVILSGGRDACRVRGAPLASEAGQDSGALLGGATITSYQPERVEIEVSLERPGYLLLTDAYYPGWEATVDGEAAPICRGDLLFRAVPLEPGEHRVVLIFRPAIQRVGIGITFVGLVAAALIWAVGLYVSRQVGEADSLQPPHQ